MNYNNLKIPNIRLFVFGTLRVGEELDYYMEGSSPLGVYYTRGQLMESAIGNAYIDFDADDVATIGELHHVNYYCLQRINHLENNWGEFPKGYELTIVPVWNYQDDETLAFNEDKKTIALCYRRKLETKIPSGQWSKRKNVLQEIGRYLEDTEGSVYHNDIIHHVVNYIKY